MPPGLPGPARAATRSPPPPLDPPPPINKNCLILRDQDAEEAGPSVQSVARVEQSAVMQKHRSSEAGGSVLRPTTPLDIGSRTQRARIVDAIIESCGEKTYAATTITDIVGKARISRTTFYKHFDDKRACFDAAIEYCISELEAAAA